MKIEWAKDEDAERIQLLLANDGLILDGGKWIGLGRTWLVARDDTGKVQACVAVHHGVPIGRLDFMAFDPDLQGLSRVRVAGSIIEAAHAVLGLAGSSFVAGMVSYLMPEFGDFLAKRGGKAINEGWLYIASLSDVLTERNRVNGRRIEKHDHDDGNADAGGDRIH